jgi:O-acetyl-ADP-ribose deacetylase (regulator of RNase III)
MPVRFVSGDLFLSGAQTLAHGVNCRGRMGAGIAVEFKRQYPTMSQEYRRRCRVGDLQPGEIFLWRGPDRWILNLATQDSLCGTRLQYVVSALRNVASAHERVGIQSIAMPQIASGLGGLRCTPAAVSPSG